MGLRKLLRFPATSSNPRPCMLYMCMLLLSRGDTETHPGPSCYPCAYCQLNVDWSSSGICCDNCNVWLHRSCADLSLSGYNKLSNISVSWRCYRCNCSNQPGSRYHSYEFEVSNPYDVLSRLPSNSTDQDISSTQISLDLARTNAVRLSVTPGPSQIWQTHNLKLLTWARQVSRIGRVLGLAEGVGPLNINPTVPRPKTQINGGRLLSTAMVCLVNMQSWPTWSLILTRMCWFSRRLSSTILSIHLNFYQKVTVVLPARTEINQVEVSCSPLNLITV